MKAPRGLKQSARMRRSTTLRAPQRDERRKVPEAAEQIVSYFV